MKIIQSLCTIRYLFTCAILCFVLKVGAQVPPWGWSDSNHDIGDTHLGSGYRITGDLSGNIIIAATFEDSVSFGSSILSTNAWGENLIVEKFDHDGNPLWAKCSDSVTSIVRPSSICTDADDNIFVTGEFQSPTINFGSITLINSGGVAPFLVKYDSNGNVLWAHTINSWGYNTITGTATDTSGNLYIIGTLVGPAGMIDTINFSAPANSDAFIAKFDASGNALWVKIISGPLAESGLDIATDSQGNVFVSGEFESILLTADTVTLTNTSTPYLGDIFLFKLNNSGNIIWGRSAGSVNMEYESWVATGPSGEVYLGGKYSSTCTFNSISVTSDSPGNNLFLTKYDSLGMPLWVRTVSGSSFTGELRNIACSPSGDIFIAGDLYEPGILGSFPLPCLSGIETAMLAAFNSAGTVKWATTYDCPGQVSATDVFSDSAGYVFVTGSFNPTLTLGSTTHGSFYMGFYIASMVPTESSITKNYPTPNSLNVYPNPSLGSTDIIFQNTYLNAELRLYNSTGVEVKKINSIVGKEVHLSTTNLVPGIYFLTLIDNNTVIATQKVLVLSEE